jgi:catechol 2,3-dioxygenase
MVAPSVEIRSVLDAATRLGAVHVTVSDVERSIAWYKRVLGFQVHAQQNAIAELGAGRETLVVLHEQPGARPVRNRTGLYHFAILTPSRQALAEVLRNLVATDTPFGESDHFVSEALYLSDPDGNGIEVYRDRPRSAWRYANGQIVMGSQPLDHAAIFAELDANAGEWQGLRPETVLGHMHLHVAHLDRAIAFYRDVIGFALMATWQGAAGFLGAGGYHHHLGVNTWAGVGAPPPPPDAVGLRHWTVVLANAGERARLVERLERAGIEFEDRDDGLFVRDPSQNAILFVVDTVQA